MFRIKNSCSWGTLLVLVVALGALPSAHAQVKGSFTGTVSDSSGAMIPVATVTATNEGTNVSVARPTNTDGLYLVPDLLPGFYTMKAEAKGFKTSVNQHIELTVGYVQRVNFTLEVGAVTQEVTVSGEAPAVETESSRMSNLVTAAQVQNLPLNGRNIFQLAQLAPGAVDVSNLITEPGTHGNGVLTTVVNGARVNMNGYFMDGIPDKGLSGGSNTTPSIDTVQEFRVDTEVLSAQYGSTVGALTQIVTKSGSNAFHGDVYDYVRNEKFDSREFFEKPTRNPFKMNQFGGVLGGPIKKNKLFFFASYEGERTRVSTPESLFVETPAFHQFVSANLPNSVAALLYKNFPGPAPTGPVDSLATYVTADSVGAGWAASSCDPSATPPGGFTAKCLSDTYGMTPGGTLSNAFLANANLPTFGSISASAPEESRAQFYNGNQFSGRIDYQGEKNSVFGHYFFDRFADPLFSPGVNGGNPAADVAVRGFSSPEKFDYPHVALSWTHTLSPTLLNEMRAGYNRNVTDVAANSAGVPSISIDTGEVEFGNYAGYPQIFHEEVFHYSDMVTLNHGKHTVKIGGSVQRNYENSEFNVGRPSNEFGDSIAFSLAQVEFTAAGVDPGQIDPATGQSLGGAHLSSNIRAWRNWEYGAFVNDDYKISPRVTLTLGLRYDLYTRHTEKYGQVTQLILPASGANITERVRAINCYVDVPAALGFDGAPCNGGFAKKSGALTTGDYNNLGPRVGFAWDVLGNGKTSLRGGFGVSYQGEVYNPLSNSRWNPPFYSFNETFCGSGSNVTPDKTVSDGCVFGPVGGGTPTFTGPPSNVGAGPAGATGGAFAGNIQGWNPYNANAAFLTGIAFPGFRDPYVYGSHLSLEHEFAGQTVLKVSWVGTFGHKLYRAEDINRVFAGRDLKTASGPTFSGPCALFGPYRVNCLFGRLRTWENSVNSNYDALQVVLDKRMTHGLELHSSYVWSHSLDTRSTWHSGATTSNGAAEGFSMDQARPGLDYGHSIFDVRHRFTNSFVWEMPWYKSQQGAAGHILGGWQLNNIITLRGGFPWTPYCSSSSFPGGNTSSCDFNRDGIRNDRPNQPVFGNSSNSSRAAFEPDHPALNLTTSMFLSCSVSPRPSCSNWPGAYDGNLGRNTFRGPSFQEVDLSMFKNIKVNERVNLQFRAEAFNLFNRTNLQMPSPTLASNASQFGLSSQTFFPREIQFALKMIF